MNEDIFDIVDENNNVIGKAPRSEVHASGLAHRAVHVLIYCDTLNGRKLLLQKRSALKDLFPNLYTTSCSGHVDSGESYEVAVVREMREETGINVDISQLKLLCSLSACPETGNEFINVYEFYCSEYENFSASQDEVSEFKWMSENEVIEMMKDKPELFTPSFIYVVKQCLI